MPNIQSARKRVKTNEKRRIINRARRHNVKTQIRKFLEAVHDREVDKATEEFRRVTKMLDQTAAKGTLHKNMVSRKKSRLAARLNALTAVAK